MRLSALALALPLFALQAHAQNAPATAAPTATTGEPAGAPANTPPADPAPHHRMTWQERFAQANISKDGRLTLQQAEDGYRVVARHFQEIDVDKKGYVTVADVATWHKVQRAMRHTRNSEREPGLRPRHAIQRGLPPAHGLDTSSSDNVVTTPPAQSRAPATNAGNAAVEPHHGT